MKQTSRFTLARTKSPEKAIKWLSCLLLSACATSSSIATTVPLDAKLEGTWTGNASFTTLSGRNALYALAPVIVISISTDTARVAGICPTSVRQSDFPQGKLAPSLVMAGAGAAAAWSGALECPKVELVGCDSVTVYYQSATMTLTKDNQLTIVALGKAEGCIASYRIILTYIGTR